MTYSDFIEKVKSFEGFRGVRYLDPVGVPTIGYGFTKSCFTKSTEACIPYGEVPETISREVADQMLLDILNKVRQSVTSYMVKHGYALSENQIFALTDFTYNCGMKNLESLTQNGKRTIAEITKAIRLYNRAGGKILAGLVARRQWEYELFCDSPDTEVPTIKDIQKLLNNLYGYRLEIDGKAGPLTRTAIYNSILK